MKATVGSKEYQFRYTVNGLCMIEKLAGMPIDRLMDRQFSATRLLVWGGLVADIPNLTVREAGEILQEHVAGGGKMEDIVEICADGLRESGFMRNQLEKESPAPLVVEAV